MNNMTKRLMIYSLAGIMQVGIGMSVATTVIEASPYHDGPRVVQLDDRHDDRQREHDRRVNEEHKRHQQEMKRHPHESEEEWHQRQERENERHEQELRDIAALLIGIAIGSSGN